MSGETCPGSGQRTVEIGDPNLVGCPECRCAWDRDLFGAATVPEHLLPDQERETPDA
jgi:hypothetical protein